MQEIFIAFLLSILLLPSLLLRYLPFKPFLTKAQNKRLAFYYAIWFVLLFALDFYMICTFGFSIKFYKLAIILGWLPYLLINIICIPHHLEHHIFVAGMQCIYVMLVHGAAVFILALVFPHFTLIQFAYLQTTLFMLIFAATYPFIRNFFVKVFLASHAINDHSYWRSVCLIPALIIADLMYLSYSNTILAIELFVPRLILLPTFIALMYSFSYDVNRLEDTAALDATNKFLALQLSSLKEHTKLMEESNNKMVVIRHDIRHYNRLLYTLVKEGKTAQALQLIDDCDQNMVQTIIHSFCKNAIINAALSIYITKAQQEDIPIEHKIALPDILDIDENELAILLSNLLENALQATRQEAPENRYIRFTAKTEKNHLVLSLENLCTKVVNLGEDGLPCSNKKGHGLGMRSLKAFKEKYNATVFCSQQEGWFRTLIYVKK